ncbi:MULTISPECIES: hypothetical protein [unclassified Aurantimonas]|uniref:hypothetical protein n=1 Tax=unclassified Aurantimonas TaxID=2638230 RepID=UPI002E19070F|nr:hypothetical protein [Aurantimonas sp. A3-2-R12]
METIGLILVVAPDRDFRKSLEFALEAEMYEVDSHAGLTSALASPRVRWLDCAIVDEKAVRDHTSEWDALERLGAPVIFLMDKRPPPTDFAQLTILTKPFLGNALIQKLENIAGSPATR